MSLSLSLAELTKPLPDTEHLLLLSAINALRIAGQEGIADNLDKRLEQIAKTPKVAVWVDGGMVQAVRSNIGPELELEIVDTDTDPELAEARWDELQHELTYGNY